LREETLMPWPIEYFDRFEDMTAKYGTKGPWPIGVLYPDPEYLDHKIAGKPLLSPQYREGWQALRPPLVVELPCGHFCVDMVTMTDGVPGDSGWEVSGHPAQMTLKPSVNIKGAWHGFITNGVISDDVEGRTFAERRATFPEGVAHAVPT
jgi:hypothetical protein